MNPFLTTQWMDAWYREWGGRRRLVPFTVGKETFTLVTLSRLFRIYANPGLRRTSYMDCSGSEQLVEGIRARVRWGVLLVFDVPDGSTMARCLTGLNARSVPLYQTPIMRLERSLDGFMQEQFSSKGRRELRRHVERLLSVGKFVFRVYDEPRQKEEAAEHVAWLCRFLEERYLNEKRQYNAYATEKGRRFLETIVSELTGKGVQISVCTVDEVPISVVICYKIGARLIYAIPAMDCAFTRFGVGHIHLMKLTEWSCEQGLEMLDLSKGWAEYKQKWANDSGVLSLYVLPLGDSFIEHLMSSAMLCGVRAVGYLRSLGVSRMIRYIRWRLSSNRSAVSAKRSAVSVLTPASGVTPGDESQRYSAIAHLPLQQRRTFVDAAFRRSIRSPS